LSTQLFLLNKLFFVVEQVSFL